MAERKSDARKRAEDRVLQIVTGAGRSRPSQDENVGDVFRQLLSEASDPSKLEGPPTKRRRIGQGTRPQPIVLTDTEDDRPASTRGAKVPLQTIEASDQSEDSDFEWEDADISGAADGSPKDIASIDSVTFEIARANTTPQRSKRRGQTKEERQLAISVHQTHVLCLLFHTHLRNAWCNDRVVEANLRKVLSAKIIGQLNPDPTWLQLRQADSFADGLKLAVDVWRTKFRVTESGTYKAQWAPTSGDLTELSTKIEKDTETLTKADFVQRSKSLRGSQDLGNQLFCALLRAVGVEARLVCSLQPLPLSMSAQSTGPSTPRTSKPAKPRIYATFENEQDTTTDEESELRAKASRTRARLGQPSMGLPIGAYEFRFESAPRQRVRKLEYPIFWVEVLNPAYTRWTAVDPLVTSTIGKPSKLEPPASYEMNTMTYAIAFDQDGTAKDVTRRYSKSFNAKTRKLRVDGLKDGQSWLRRAMRPFRRGGRTDRDQIEDSELSRKEAQEGLPNNIQDFKDHPVYALERHLKRNEVIWPKREVGRVNAGKASSATNMESVYRRNDVHIVQSADKWYRAGREIKPREQPMKHVPARSRRPRSPGDEDDGEAETTALYAFSQTEPYIPPPVLRGKVPKNAYGNIDVYVPAMVPAGGIHIKHPSAKRAAQLLGLDYADAVTGFHFKGRHGTAIVQGIVVALENKDAVESVIIGFQDAVKQEEDDQRSLEALRLWRRFLLGLQIAERIGLTDIYAADDQKQDEFKKELAEAEEEQQESFEAGGFFPDAGADEVIKPTGHLFSGSTRAPQRGNLAARTAHEPQQSHSVRRTKRMLADSDEDAMYEPDEPETQPRPQSHATLQEHDMLAGGFNTDAETDVFVSSANEDAGGGFVVDPEQINRDSHVLMEETGGGFMVETPEVDELPAVGVDPQDEVIKSVASEGGEEDMADDIGSLLSHDPEDDDADPDWLEAD